MGNKQQSNLVDAKGAVKATIAGPTFGDLEFSIPENAGIYENRSGKSTTAATVKIPIAGIGIVMAGTVYADLSKDGIVTFRASLPRGITATDAIKAEYKLHAKNGLKSWSGFNRAAKAAYDRLTKPADKSGANPDAPLVWKPEPDAEPLDGASSETAA